eukprot:29870_1
MTSIVLLNLLVQMMYKLQSQMMSEWKTPVWRFTEKDQNSLVVFDNVTRDIWIMGGFHHRERIYNYNIDNKMVVDVTSSVNPTEAIFGFNYLNGRNTVLINRTIYFVSHVNTKVHTFNIETLQYNDDIGIDNGKWNPCMVTNAEQTKLYITAGYQSKTFFVWDLQTSTEIKGAPNHNHEHTGGVCHVVDNILYVMTGNSLNGVTSTIIEYIDLNTLNDDIINAKWNIVPQQFPSSLYSSASAVCGNLIFIIGGTLPDGTVTNSVFLFDTKTHTITETNILPVNISWAPAICVENRIYIFMGYWVDEQNSAIRDTWMYSDVNTVVQSTQYPSYGATKQPTNNPTHQPIQYKISKGISSDWINPFVWKTIIVVFSIFSLLCIVDYLHSKCSYKYRWGMCVANGCYKSDRFNYRLIWIVAIRITDLLTDIVMTYMITKKWV